ncbi:TrV6 [Tranosema rostrale ichnovirus]|nr:TrV6 [Tranosema rostrale ichnovirus]
MTIVWVVIVAAVMVNAHHTAARVTDPVVRTTFQTEATTQSEPEVTAITSDSVKTDH